jgi:CHAT domain-containing protein/Tfp pilus assembly protein PilF
LLQSRDFLLLKKEFSEMRINTQSCKWLALLLLFRPLSCFCSADATGLTVMEVVRLSEAETAGLMPGDVLKSWSRGETTGKLASPYELYQVEVEQSPLGGVEVSGYRGTQGMTWRLGEHVWQIVCRPPLPDRISQPFEQARESLASGKAVQAATRFEDVASRVGQSDPVLAGWLHEQAGHAFTQAASWMAADKAYGSAVTALKRVSSSGAAQVQGAWAESFRARGDIAEAAKRYESAIEQCRLAATPTLALAATLMAAGNAAYAREDFTAAEKLLREALDIRERLAPKSVAAAQPLNRLGVLERRRGKLDVATQLLKRSLAHLETAGPDTLETASALNGLGTIAMDTDNYADSRKYLERALEIQRRRGPDSLDYTATLNNLGLLLKNMGEMLEAQDYFLAALAINQKIAPNGIEVARNLSNLGMVVNERGDVAQGEEYLSRALEIQKRLAPGSYSAALSLANLGAIAVDRWDLAGAEDRYNQAIAILQRVAPDSPVLPGLELNLGDLALKRDDVEKAERHFRSALARHQKSSAESMDVAIDLHALAIVSKRKSDLAEAERIYHQVLDLQTKLAPTGLEVASTLHDLAEVEEARGNVAKAEEDYRHALEIRSRLASGSRIEAESLYALAKIARQKGDRATALRLFEDGITALERQTSRLGGSGELRAGFGARNNAIYRDYMEMLLAGGETGTAFQILERSRARDLLRILAERDLVFASEISAELRKQLRSNAAEYDRVQGRIGEMDPKTDAAGIESQLARLRELTAERARIDEQIKRASPRLAGLKYPKPLGVSEAAATLDPGTLLLSYAVGEEHTTLFALRLDGSKPQLTQFSLPVKEAGLRSQIALFTQQIGAPTPVNTGLRSTAQGLYQDLLGPAEALIDSADRILVIPDGPLHLLPFACLMRGNQYFIERKPLHIALSATVYGELRKSRRSGHASDLELVAFGDPRFPNWNREHFQTAADEALRMASERGMPFARLPFSRGEIEGIAGLFQGHSRVFLGTQATEEAAKSLVTPVRFLHFATHGVLDERLPLNSAIVLSIPERLAAGVDNGLLQAWEIIENVRWNADLVVLSACRSALGQELAGEGLIGLTRAIQFAGARSVIASLWNVDDRRTATLMKRLYSELRNGETKDEALRAAQIEMLRSGAARPFYWAAFTLNGDWQ